jgi:hypothetical protein
MNYGYVYCMINQSMPDLCKIGMVHKENKTSHDRAKELSDSTSSPLPFKVVFDIKVKEPFKYEKKIHNKLSNFRENKKREFFRCNPEDIEKYFKMENLMEIEEERNDFAINYFNKYNEQQYIILEKYKIDKYDIIKIVETKYKYFLQLKNIMQNFDNRVDKKILTDKKDDLLKIFNNSEFKKIFNSRTIKNEKATPKKLLGSLNSVYNMFGMQLENIQEGSSKYRTEHLEIKLIDYIPKCYVDYEEYINKYNDNNNECFNYIKKLLKCN